MTTLTADNATITMSAGERPDLLRLAQFLADQGTAPARLVGANGTAVVFPDVALRVLKSALDILSLDQGLVILPTMAGVGTAQAAEFLNLDHAALLRLLDTGEITAAVIDEEPRVRAGDLVRYKARRQAHERQGLDELARLSEDLGLYDLNDPVVVEE